MNELKKAVITGATSGIGFALAQALAQSGQVLAIGGGQSGKIKKGGRYCNAGSRYSRWRGCFARNTGICP